ncbi:16 kDa calcium-binding protein-like [Tubulanus polymorphus]|uniref:16 kDa calcium-binding protein-like n=1 Tax=Tubulanus polymorphus TaxID=672921 RepID=UPI003DA26E34
MSRSKMVLSKYGACDEHTAKTCDQFMETFRKTDKDNNGKLSYKEVEDLLKSQGVTDPEALAVYFQFLDCNEDDKVDENEFLKALVGHCVQDAWRKAFRFIDTDGNGTIEATELEKFMQTTQIESSCRKSIRNFIREHDLDGDGKLNYDEFVEKFLKNLNI